MNEERNCSKELKDINTKISREKVDKDKARAAELGLNLTEYYLYLLVEYKYLGRI